VIKLNVKLDIQAARASLKGLEKEVNKAAIRALTRVATTARKEADQEIRQRLTLTSAAVKKALLINKHRNVLIVDIDATGKPIALREWKARETRKGVTFQVSKGKPRKIYRRQGRTGFVIDKYGRHVFVRTGVDPPGKAKAPMQKVYGPSIPQYFVTKTVTGRMTRVAATRWPIEFERELAFRAKKAKG
jgi:formamidopyrimidine-DNA glycosylase